METHFPGVGTSESALARERTLADLKALVNDAEALLRATADDASEKSKEVRARVSAALERAKANYAAIQQRGVEAAQAAAKRTDETIRAHPYESLAVAFGVGVLLGALLRRK